MTRAFLFIYTAQLLDPIPPIGTGGNNVRPPISRPSRGINTSYPESVSSRTKIARWGWFGTPYSHSPLLRGRPTKKTGVGRRDGIDLFEAGGDPAGMTEVTLYGDTRLFSR